MDRAFSLVQRAVLLLLVGALVLFSSPHALADRFNTATSEDARDLGMGSAGINLSRGPYSVFYNPANIASKETGTHLELVNFQFDMPTGTLSALSHADVGALSFMSLSSLKTAALKYPNTFEGGRVSVYPNITIRNLSFGLLYEVNQGTVYNPQFGSLRVLARDRLAPTAAFSERFMSGILRLGAAAQYVTVGTADKTLPAPIPSNLDFKSYVNAASALSLSGGATLTLPFRFLPSFSLVGRDLGNARYTTAPLVKFGSQYTPYTQPMTFDFGSSMTFLLGRRLEMRVGFDYHDLTNKLAGQRFQHVFTGTEFMLYDIFRLRAGLAHGYPSFGFGLDTPKASLDLAVYSDELDDRLRSTQETRYVFQYTWGLFK